ncbi:MAG TPA: HAD-IIA family hydrolase [Ignavibacteriaceae bacterium]|nr:HAD-IIA family hydrolase [Ignavibacteriaceae bacterium]
MRSSLTIPILIDLDGILRIGDKLSNHASSFLRFLTDEKLPAIILSNSTLSSSDDVRQFFLSNNIELSIPVMTTIDATLNYISESNKKVSVYCNDRIKKVFSNYIDDDEPTAVVIGDLGKSWTYEILNDILRKVLAGAEIIAMQKNRYWNPPGEGVSLDAGAFIAAIEYSTSKKSILIGKPSPVYFQKALKAIGFKNNSDFIMIGDDIETDIEGAQNAGGKGVLVYTGKTKKIRQNNNSVIPNYEAENLIEVISILKDIL